MKIAIMGYYPPPVGGISVHVKRLGDLLKKHKINYKIYSISQKDRDSEFLQLYTNRRKWAMSYALKKKEDIIHCHTMGWSEKAFYTLIAKLSGKKVLFTFHSYRDHLKTQKGFYRLSLKFVRKFGDGFIAVGEHDYKQLVEDGFKENKLYYLPGFIAPKEEDIELPKYISSFIERHSKTFCANAANMNFYKDQDLYGIDLCIELTASLVHEHGLDVGCVFFLSAITKADYYVELRNRIKDLNIENHFLICHEKVDFYHVIKDTDVFIRPTNTDGDAISIREALYYGKKAISSDVVKRPSGTLLFKNRDLNDLVKVSLSAFSSEDMDKSYGEDYGIKIIDIYKDIYKHRKSKV